jgi:peptide/nickel transport system substrate-binding protein
VDSPAVAASVEVTPPSQQWLDGRLPAEVSEGTPVSGGTLTVRSGTEPEGLNPLNERQINATVIRYLVGPIYETLFEIDRDDHPRYRIRPLLAESYSESKDRLVQVIRLRKGVRFHNGQLFTSKDIKAVLDAVMDPKNPASSFRSFFADLAEYKAPRRYTFVLKWKRPSYLGFRNFAIALPMIPASALQGDFNTLPINREPVGTGPFRFVSWESNKAMTFANNDKYWGTKAYLDKIVVRIVKDHTAATQMFERGEFDLMTLIQPVVWRAIEKPTANNAWAFKNYNRIYFLENNYSYIGWNERRPFFKDVRVRRALALLFPYDQVQRTVDQGLEIPTTCPFYIESSFCDPDVKRLERDPAAARRMLTEAGWVDTNNDGILDKDGVPFKFSVLMSAHSVRAGKIASLLQNEYRKVGIAMDIEKLQFPVMSNRLIDHDFDAVFLLWSNPDVEQDNFLIFHSSQTKGYNYVSYEDPEVDELLVKSRSAFDDAKRIELGRQLHRKIYADQVYTFISARPILDAVKKNVRGIKPSIAWYDLRKIWIQPLERAEK